MRTRRHLLIAGAASTAVLLSLSTAAPALAAGEVVVTDRETVQAYLTPTGEVKVARVYDQITATGQGTVDIANPVNTDGLRDLEELGDVEVEDGKAVTELEVDGEDRLRTVSSFDENDLPVTIKPTYELDGKVYDDPEDLVGKSGELKVTYRVENVTSEPTTITVQDGKGQDVEQTVDVPMPLVGSLVTVLPKGFYSVRSDQANISADGRGGTRHDLHDDAAAADRLDGRGAQLHRAGRGRDHPEGHGLDRGRPAAEEPEPVDGGRQLPGRRRHRRHPHRRRRGDRLEPAQAARRRRPAARRPDPAPRRCPAAQRRPGRRGSPGARRLADGAGEAAVGAASSPPDSRTRRRAAATWPTVSGRSPTATTSSRRRSTARPEPRTWSAARRTWRPVSA